MKNNQMPPPALAEPASLLRATARRVGYTLISAGGSWLLWHYSESEQAFLPGLGEVSTEFGRQAQVNTIVITLGTLLTSGLLWWKTFLGY